MVVLKSLTQQEATDGQYRRCSGADQATFAAFAAKAGHRTTVPRFGASLAQPRTGSRHHPCPFYAASHSWQCAVQRGAASGRPGFLRIRILSGTFTAATASLADAAQAGG